MEVFELDNVGRYSQYAVGEDQHAIDSVAQSFVLEDMAEGLRHETSLAPVDGGLQAWALVGISDVLFIKVLRRVL